MPIASSVFADQTREGPCDRGRGACDRLAENPGLVFLDVLDGVLDCPGCAPGAPRLKDPPDVERGVGLWEGMAWDEIENTYPDDWQAWLSDIVHYQPKGGESLLQVRARVMPALYNVLDEYREKEILLVAHGGVNRIILSEAMQLDLRHVFRIEQGYGRLNIIDFYEDGMSVVKLLNG